ncbi:hypothetical protein OKW21_000590 [Catalinimonas alkaloidigena]|uniref:hypothetical protein n=1 Tax=Catalinimonas alkaloidigena TaxID=1075417 RepID=UPI0024072C4E|nr:hypothetical protein [Catalinimonas alkaloidigena]MDF9795327.1 hypothetical protein [Catalinimonas alkaloidigena]
MPNKKFELAPYDTDNATYMQVIRFLNGKVIPGYSKKVGFDENVDPTNTLTNFILRMYVKGYLRPSKRITPVKEIEYKLNQPPYTTIVTCTYKMPYLNPEYLRDKRLSKWLSGFYDAIERGQPKEHIERNFHRQGRASEVDKLDSNVHAFLNPRHLLQYCIELIEKNEYPIGHIIHFYQNCKNKYFSRIDTRKFDNEMFNRTQNLAEEAALKFKF